MKILIVLLISCALVAHVHCAARKSKDYAAADSSSSEEQRKNSNESKEERKHQQQQHRHHHQQQKKDQDSDSQESQSDWSSEISNLPDQNPFLRKISDRLERLPETTENREIKQRVINHVKEELKDCKSHTSHGYNKHCLGQLTGNTMALINRLEKDAKRN